MEKQLTKLSRELIKNLLKAVTEDTKKRKRSESDKEVDSDNDEGNNSDDDSTSEQKDKDDGEETTVDRPKGNLNIYEASPFENKKDYNAYTNKVRKLLPKYLDTSKNYLDQNEKSLHTIRKKILSEYPILKVETTPFTINATLSRQLTYTKNRHYKELGLSKPAREGKRKKQRVTVPPATVPPATPTHAQAEQEVQVQGDTAGPGCSNETVTIQEDLSHIDPSLRDAQANILPTIEHSVPMNPPSGFAPLQNPPAPQSAPIVTEFTILPGFLNGPAYNQPPRRGPDLVIIDPNPQQVQPANTMETEGQGSSSACEPPNTTPTSNQGSIPVGKASTVTANGKKKKAGPSKDSKVTKNKLKNATTRKLANPRSRKARA